MFDRLFLKHPRSVGESYAEHAAVAGSVGFTLIRAGLACLVHAAVPALFTRTGSTTITRLYFRLAGRKPTPEELPAGVMLYDI
ncbi:DUF6356 family protein [Sphingomonas sp. ID0503]|uniref:DUF6356 family protein n=1 Tax=Sphingomonas sp. ID0503 TaxID=3399691 RepID=UPI003AFB33AF